MPYEDYLILIGMGGLFIFLGLAAIFRGKSEEKDYYNSLSARTDMREFLERLPERPEPGALKIGGWIATAAGLLMLVTGAIFWLLD